MDENQNPAPEFQNVDADGPAAGDETDTPETSEDATVSAADAADERQY